MAANFSQEAKSYLESTHLYEHLTNVIAKLIDERHPEPLRIFESISEHVKSGAFVPEKKTSIYVPEQPAHKRTEIDLAKFNAWAQNLINMVKPKEKKKPAEPVEGEEPPPEEEEEAPEEDPENVPDLLNQFRLLESAGISLLPEEVYTLSVSVKKLMQAKKLTSARFFGKILGTQRNYYIVEGEYLADFRQQREDDAKAAAEAKVAADAEAAQAALIAAATPAPAADADEGAPPPEPNPEFLAAQEALAQAAKDAEEDRKAEAAAFIPSGYVKPVEIGIEKYTGVNKYSYFVCNVLGEEWIELPEITPQQIEASRRIKRFFTGNLSAAVPSHPAFPGDESIYLRAQVSRIAAATTLAPKGQFSFTEEPELDDNGQPKAPTFEPPTEVKEIKLEEKFLGGMNEESDPPTPLPVGLTPSQLRSLDNWVHIYPAILQTQSRVTLWKPEAAEDEEPAEEEDPNAPPKEPIERVAPLLWPVSQDAHITGSRASPAWTVSSLPSSLPESQQYTVSVARSARWPGALSYLFVTSDSAGKAKGIKSGNVYIGFGQKCQEATVFTPQLPSVVIPEDAAVQTLSEQVDATVEQEASFAEPPPPPPVVEAAPPAEGEGEQPPAEGEGEAPAE